jgi:hypothetical protein
MDSMIRRISMVASFAAASLAALPAVAPAQEVEPILEKAEYADATTYACRTNAITIHPGQNLNNFGGTQTCPNAVKLSGPGRATGSGLRATRAGFSTT